ncbi:MAG: hypothetical protein RIB45_13610 [Marivibrio sp.]|uniref:hypothetical protein n=1 Tax=Marivibrio sp. TaxID=2039719 RepID=UPI0032EA9E88
MSSRHGEFRIISALALLDLSERDLKQFYVLMQSLGFEAFVDIVRHAEDEVVASFDFIEGTVSESNSMFEDKEEDLVEYINKSRRSDLRLTVSDFVDYMTFELKKLEKERPIPRFDNRRGIKPWLKKIINLFGQSAVLHCYHSISENINYRKEHQNMWRLK